MIIFPAIDLKDGKCVRLYKGDMQQDIVYNDSPVDQAKIFEQEGASWIHIVDLNGAFEGKQVNGSVVEEILKNVNCSVQLGGGIRTIDSVEYWLSLGIARVVLGTLALKNPEIVKEACRKFPGKIAVGVDARSGFVAVEGWSEASEVRIEDLAKQFEGAGVACLIYTDIERDGVLAGPNIESTRNLAKSTSIPVIASGGVSKIEDLEALKDLKNDGVIGAISGKAIYEEKISLKEAIKVFSDA